MSSEILEKKEKASEFLNNVLACFKGDFEAELSIEEACIFAEIKGEDVSLLTARDGKVLEALRILTSSVINNKDTEFIKVNVDAGGFRQKKDDKIRALALSLAEKVKAEGESLALPDMNSYDRRIAHMALQGDPLIKTESEGEEPHRHLVVFPA